MLDPIRHIERKEIDELKSTKSRTEILDPKRLTPKTEMELPSLSNERREMELPRLLASKTERVDPKRLQPYKELDDPERRKVLSDKVEPIWKKSNTQPKTLLKKFAQNLTAWAKRSSGSPKSRNLLQVIWKKIQKHTPKSQIQLTIPKSYISIRLSHPILPTPHQGREKATSRLTTNYPSDKCSMTTSPSTIKLLELLNASTTTLRSIATTHHSKFKEQNT